MQTETHNKPDAENPPAIASQFRSVHHWRVSLRGMQLHSTISVLLSLLSVFAAHGADLAINLKANKETVAEISLKIKGDMAYFCGWRSGKV
jgi:hypothetical protein